MDGENELERVRLERLHRDPAYQVRGKLDAGNVERLRRAYRSGRIIAPITVAVIDGRPAPVLLDGWHRVEAMLSLGTYEADAIVIRTTAQDARWLAASANMNHGLQLKPRELRKVFGAFIRARKHHKRNGQWRSYRELAPEIGVSHETVRKWMMKDFPRIAAQMGSGNDSFVGTGGLVEGEAPDSHPDDPVRATIEAAFVTIGETFKAVASADVRGQLIELAERIVVEMKAVGEWRASDF
jgi:hypothetical protein